MNIISTEQYKEKTQPGSGRQVVIFSAEWCGPCKLLVPVINSVSKEHENVEFSKIDIEKELQLTVSLGISSIPTIIFLNDGDVKYRHVGSCTTNYMNKFINEYLP